MSLETIDFDRLNIRPGDRLLDLGCGEGRHSISAHLQSNADIIGLDLGLLDLRTAKSRLADFPFAFGHFTIEACHLPARRYNS